MVLPIRKIVFYSNRPLSNAVALAVCMGVFVVLQYALEAAFRDALLF